MKKLTLVLFISLVACSACQNQATGINNNSDSSARAIKESAYDTTGANPRNIGSGTGTGANLGGSGTNTGGASRSTPAPGLGKPQQ